MYDAKEEVEKKKVEKKVETPAFNWCGQLDTAGDCSIQVSRRNMLTLGAGSALA
jgi:hypothetical protein